eukprot:TRINITY_DN21114_c0_g3_i1.p1 TRINITY_DN21114_c0_g3~~TRINITY_DN21114_c0_g3_i1.p1  ORF type:complete len:513 (-),score=40.39 TRINITY_DN21114_c0_g3_i1:696-2234(-)
MEACQEDVKCYSQFFFEKAVQLRSVLDRQAQLITQKHSVNLQDFQTKLSLKLSPEVQQIVGGYLTQFLQEELLIYLSDKIQRFNRNMPYLWQIGEVEIPLGVVKIQDADLPDRPFKFQMFFDDVEDGQPDEMNKDDYKPLNSVVDYLDDMPYSDAYKFYGALLEIHRGQRGLAMHMPPSTASSSNIIVKDKKTAQMGQEVSKILKSYIPKFTTKKEDDQGVDDQGVDECNRCLTAKNMLLFELGHKTIGSKAGKGIEQFSSAVVLRNGLEDVRQGILKIKEKYREEDEQFLREHTQRYQSMVQSLVQQGLCCKGDLVEQIKSYEEGRQAYRPMSLLEVDTVELITTGIYQLGQMKGQQSEKLKFKQVRPGYPYDVEHCVPFQWCEFQPGTRVDVLQLDQCEWIEGFVTKQDLRNEKVEVEIPNYKDYIKGTKVVIDHLQNIRISMEYIAGNWQRRQMQSVVRELMSLRQDDWWTCFTLKKTYDAHDNMDWVVQKTTEVLKELWTRIGQINIA